MPKNFDYMFFYQKEKDGSITVSAGPYTNIRETDKELPVIGERATQLFREQLKKTEEE